MTTSTPTSQGPDRRRELLALLTFWGAAIAVPTLIVTWFAWRRFETKLLTLAAGYAAFLALQVVGEHLYPRWRTMLGLSTTEV